MKLPDARINAATPRYNQTAKRYLTDRQLKQKNATLEGVVVNNFIKDNEQHESPNLDDTYNALVISDKEDSDIDTYLNNSKGQRGYDTKKAMLPLVAGTGAVFVSSALLSLVLKRSAKKNLTEPVIKQLPAMGMNLNIVEETGFATYMALRDPNRKNIMAAIAVFTFSALTLAAKKFIEGIKEIWIKKQDADIQRDLQEDLISVETQAFSGKLAVLRNMLTNKGEYLKSALGMQSRKKYLDISVYSRHFNFTGQESKDTTEQKKDGKISKFLNPYTVISALMLAGGLALGALTLKNIKSSAKIQDKYVNDFIKNKKDVLDSLIQNGSKDKALMKDVLIKMGATREKAAECAKMAGFDENDIEEIASSVSSSVENIWGNAPTGMSTESGKSFFYCYLNEARGHLYNWLIHSDNVFLKHLFFAMATVSGTSYIAQQSADALKEVAVLKENANTELNLQKRLVDVEINNFKAKKESAVAPLIEEFEHQRKEGKSPSELKVMADNILLEIKNGPPFVYS